MNWKGLLTAIAGAAIYVVLYVYLRPYLIAQFGSHWGKLLVSVVNVSFLVVIYPALIKLFSPRTEN